MIILSTAICSPMWDLGCSVVCFLVADNEEDEPPATMDPSLPPEEENMTVTSDAQSTTETTPSTTGITTTSITITTIPEPTSQDSEDQHNPATTTYTDLSQVPSTTNVLATETLEKEMIEETEEERTERENKRDMVQTILQNKDSKNAGSVSSPSLLLAGLTGILTLRL